MWEINALEKLRMGHGQKSQERKLNPSAYEERAAGDTIQRAVGRVVHDESDTAASRRPWHAWTERCRSGTKAAHKQLMRN